MTNKNKDGIYLNYENAGIEYRIYVTLQHFSHIKDKEGKFFWVPVIGEYVKPNVGILGIDRIKRGVKLAIAKGFCEIEPSYESRTRVGKVVLAVDFMLYNTYEKGVPYELVPWIEEEWKSRTQK